MRSNITGQKLVQILYCDIDGTIRHGKDELGHFVNGPDDVKVFDEVPKLLKAYKELGWRIVGITNQGGIALGYASLANVRASMQETHKQTGNLFDTIQMCVHHPDAKDPEMATCWCRKPRAGMVVEAAMRLGYSYPDEIYPPSLGLFVGDRQEDEECAANAGLRFMPAYMWRAGIHMRELLSM